MNQYPFREKETKTLERREVCVFRVNLSFRVVVVSPQQHGGADCEMQ